MVPVRKHFAAAIVAVTIGVSAAAAIESFWRISFVPRPVPNDPVVALNHSPFSLRMVDSGGIGIPIDGRWGDDYSHDRRTFRDVLRESAPYVDSSAFARVELEWRSYVDRMLDYGNNAVAVPLLLEMIDFDRLHPDAGAPSARVYDANSPFLARHAAVRRTVGPLFNWTAQRGMQVFLDTDMLAVTPPVYQLLRRLAPGRGPSEIDASNPRVWEVYRKGLEELFEKLPSVAGVVIRFGEGGSLYSTEGWPYRSEVAVRDAASLRAMLRGLLPVFEANHKTLVLRSWTVGIGKVGRLHVDPKVYDAVIGDIDSPALIVSTKITAGDFFSYLALNPTLLSGRQRRLIELQAKPEFEGFSAFPDFLGDDYGRALKQLYAANPHITGTFLFSQFGGPLRAGPRTLYPLHGFWLWTDANVYVASRLAVEPDADVHELLKCWAASKFTDPRIADAVADGLLLTRGAVLDGFYIRPFAQQQVLIGPLELPPLMWIFEWKMVGGWNSLLSLVYRGSRDWVAESIQQGHAAAARVRQAHRQLQSAIDSTAPGVCGEVCNQALRSFEYQESLFDVLAWWRQTFLSYYRWIDTGDRVSWNAWQGAKIDFANAATAHLARFGDDELFPAFDLSSARQAVATATHASWIRGMAATVLLGLVAILIIGGWRSAAENRGADDVLPPVVDGHGDTRRHDRRTSSDRLNRRCHDDGCRSGCCRVRSDHHFRSGWIVAGTGIVISAFAVTFAFTAMGAHPGTRGRRLLIAAVGPLLPIAMFLLAALAVGGPLGFWYWFWMSRPFRVALLTVTIATVPWTVYTMYAARLGDRWPARIGGMLAAVGSAIVSLFALFPNWVDALRLLNRPLNIAPATETMLFALRTYAGVNIHPRTQILMLGALLVVCGVALCLRWPRRGTPSPPGLLKHRNVSAM